VDPDERTVEVFALQAGRYALVDRFGVGDTLHSDLLAGFEMDVEDIFTARER
jgi:Uma2 family endonuclease